MISICSNIGVSPSIRLNQGLTPIRLETVRSGREKVMGALDHLMAEIKDIRPMRRSGRIRRLSAGVLCVEGLSDCAAVGDLVRFENDPQHRLGEIVAVDTDAVSILPEASPDGLRIGDRVLLEGPCTLQPTTDWVGRVLDPFGLPLDGAALPRGVEKRRLVAPPPPPVSRRSLGRRLETGLRVFNTILPIVRGQRVGLFAGSGVGKSTLLAQLARGIEADVVVIALVGERGRELRDFLGRALGSEGLSRAVVIAATADRSPLARRLCLPAAITVAEYFRDRGGNVLLLADSITRFAEAHRDVALAAGEAPALQGFPPSMVSAITALTERTGPGAEGMGDITAIFSVLVAGSNMEGIVADTLRGVLDGHVLLDRTIAERGRFPAVDVLRSVSRSLPEAATAEENASIAEVRSVLSVCEQAELMVQAGLHVPGADPALDRALRLKPLLDCYFGEAERSDITASFGHLRSILDEG
jgi:flagellum-specific ATP synthase